MLSLPFSLKLTTCDFSETSSDQFAISPKAPFSAVSPELPSAPLSSGEAAGRLGARQGRRPGAGRAAGQGGGLAEAQGAGVSLEADVGDTAVGLFFLFVRLVWVCFLFDWFGFCWFWV